MVDRTIYSGSPFSVALASATVTAGQTAVTIVYRNVSSSTQQLVCAEPLQLTSITLNGTVYTESDSYCAKHPGKVDTVPAGSRFPSWARYNVVPQLAQPFTLNNWWGWGEVTNIQLIPFACLSGPGGGCLLVPKEVPQDDYPTPPEWLTSAATGACVLDAATFGAGGFAKDLFGLWIAGLGGVIRVQDPPGTVSITKVWIVLTSAVPFGSCAELGADVIGKALPAEAQSKVQEIANYPFLVLPR